MCLPAALASVLLGVLPSPALAARNLSAIPKRQTLREQIVTASKMGPLTLLLYVGMPISGDFEEFVGDWKDSTSAEARYKAWRDEQPERAPRAGQEIAVVLASGDTLRGAFEGLGDEEIALRTTSAYSATPVRFADVAQVLGAEGDSFAPWSELRELLAKAPVLAAVVLGQGDAGYVLVSRSRILQVTVPPDSESRDRDIATAVVIAVVLTAVICVVLVNSAVNDINDNLNSCTFQEGATLLDRRFGPATLSSGPRPYSPGDTRRP